MCTVRAYAGTDTLTDVPIPGNPFRKNVVHGHPGFVSRLTTLCLIKGYFEFNYTCTGLTVYVKLYTEQPRPTQHII
jgi:hypothetical protein